MSTQTQPEKSAKSDLLKFQRFLNEQFMEVHLAESEQGGLKLESAKAADISNELGLRFRAGTTTWFIPLKHLLHISAKAEFEPIFLTHDWISGFNHFRGEVYTVLDVSRYMGDERKLVSQNTRLVMLRDTEKAKVALLVDNVDLSHAADFTLLYRMTPDGKSWKVHEEIAQVEEFLDRNSLSELESNIFKNVAQNKRFDENVAIMPLVRDWFMDGYKPVLVLDTDAMLTDLANRSPF